MQGSKIMTKFSKSDFKPARDWINAMPEAQHRQAMEGAAKIIADARLSDVRKVLNVTQVALSAKSGLNQADVSRIENNMEAVQIKTLQKYVNALGGTMRIVADFPDGLHAEIPLRAGKPVKSKVTVSDKKISA
jgi:hypothetical protein